MHVCTINTSKINRRNETCDRNLVATFPVLAKGNLLLWLAGRGGRQGRGWNQKKNKTLKSTSEFSPLWLGEIQTPPWALKKTPPANFRFCFVPRGAGAAGLCHLPFSFSCARILLDFFLGLCQGQPHILLFLCPFKRTRTCLVGLPDRHLLSPPPQGGPCSWQVSSAGVANLTMGGVWAGASGKLPGDGGNPATSFLSGMGLLSSASFHPPAIQSLDWKSLQPLPHSCSFPAVPYFSLLGDGHHEGMQNTE